MHTSRASLPQENKVTKLGYPSYSELLLSKQPQQIIVGVSTQSTTRRRAIRVLASTVEVFNRTFLRVREDCIPRLRCVYSWRPHRQRRKRKLITNKPPS